VEGFVIAGHDFIPPGVVYCAWRHYNARFDGRLELSLERQARLFTLIEEAEALGREPSDQELLERYSSGSLNVLLLYESPARPRIGNLECWAIGDDLVTLSFKTPSVSAIFNPEPQSWVPSNPQSSLPSCAS
jgi:hypothetical protein